MPRPTPGEAGLGLGPGAGEAGPGPAPARHAARSRWRVVVPVKGAGRAKSRLEFGDDRRTAFAGAFALDTVRALIACPLVRDVLVVADRDARTADLGELGATVLASGVPAGLNEALRFGIGEASAWWPGQPLAVVLGDLPALRPASVTVALEAAATIGGTVFVADASGAGTTLLADPRRSPKPRFGGQSAAAHRRAGAVEISALVPRDLRRDVDTAADLDDAVSLGVGLSTSAVLALA